MKIRVFDDAAAVTQELLRRWEQWTAEDGVFLSGGSTFQDLYLNAPETAAQLFLADERYVPREAAESTQGMLGALYLSRFPDTAFTAPDPALPLEASATQYDSVLHEWVKYHDTFTTALLGIGSDGHTASLFPKQFSHFAEATQWFLPAEAELPPIVRRLTVTPTLLENVQELVFVATGNTKSDIIRQIVEKQADLPVTHLTGHATLLLDRAAAEELTLGDYHTT